MTKTMLAIVFLVSTSVFAAPPTIVDDEAVLEIAVKRAAISTYDGKTYVAKNGTWVSDSKAKEASSDANKKIVAVAVITAVVSIVATGVVFSAIKK